MGRGKNHRGGWAAAGELGGWGEAGRWVRGCAGGGSSRQVGLEWPIRNQDHDPWNKKQC